ncbi:MAG: hypothetical protein AAGA56_28260 [Myxococcota bacterium]
MRVGLLGSIAVVGAMSTGCSYGDKRAAVPLVRARAESDLECPSPQIDIEVGTGGRHTARGCGRIQRYDSICLDLKCQVSKVGVEPPAWRDRPLPGDANFDP